MSQLETDLLRKLRRAADKVQRVMAEFPDYPGAWDEPLSALDSVLAALERSFPEPGACPDCGGSGFYLSVSPIGSVAKASECPRGCMRRRT